MKKYPSFVLEAIRETADKGGKTLVVTKSCCDVVKEKIGPTLCKDRNVIVYPVKPFQVINLGSVDLKPRTVAELPDLSNIVCSCGVSLLVIDGVTPTAENSVFGLSEKYRTKIICL